MRALAVVTAAAVLAAAPAFGAQRPPDPLAPLGKPSKTQVIVSKGFAFYCETWRSRLGFIDRCRIVGRVKAKPKTQGL